jgi:hypothetical protein
MAKVTSALILSMLLLNSGPVFRGTPIHTRLLDNYALRENFNHYFWSRKYEKPEIKIIPLDSYSKKLSNGIFIAYTLYIVKKLMVKVFLEVPISFQ